MWRFLAGVASALLLAGAGLFWWQGKAEGDPLVPKAPLMQARAASLPDDAMPDPPRATARTREEKRFGRFDKDRNGAVTTEEYFASRHKAFAKLDADGDGRLSFDEWAVKTREKFSKADADRSHALSRTEFATTAPVRKVKPRPDCPPARPRKPDEEEG